MSVEHDDGAAEIFKLVVAVHGLRTYVRRGPASRGVRAGGSALASESAPLPLASVIPAPDVIVTADPSPVTLEPGQEVKVTLHVDRRNGFQGRVPCTVRNLPPGVRVVNVGLNGVLVTESQSTRTFTLHAEDWANPITQPIYVVGEVESNSPTMHPSAPLMVEVVGNKETASVKAGGQ